MIRHALIAAAVLAVSACAPEAAFTGTLLHANAEVAGLQGLERLDATGPFQGGSTERFKLHADTTVAQVSFSASEGALTTSGREVEWKLPAGGTAELTATLTRRDGSTESATWSFRLARTVEAGAPMNAEQALLATPMPVLDGGSLEISGGSCEVRYEGTTTNVGIAFTTETHPSLMYGRWNGTAWALELVDAMGFNTGGVVRPLVSMQVEANGTPHIVYVRDNTVMYATKSGGVWTRERVDATNTYTTYLPGDETTSPSIALNGTTPMILYTTGFSAASSRPVVATRTGPNAWTTAVVTVPGLTTNDRQYPYGELNIDGAGRALFPLLGFDATTFNSSYRLVAWTSAATTSITLTPSLTGRTDTVLASPTRLLMRNRLGLYDVTLNATFTASTLTFSSVESSTGTDVGDLAWSASLGRPVELHSHSGSLELVTPNANGFWTYQQLGTTTAVSAGLAVNPSTGDASICYQAGGRIMFQ